MIDRLDDLIGEQVVAKTGAWTFTGTLQWTTAINCPGSIDVLNKQGEIEIGGMPWSFDSIEPAR